MNQQNNFDVKNNYSQEEVIDLARYWRILMQRKWSILGLAFIFSVLATFVVFTMKPVYSASTTILIESKQASSIKEVYILNTKIAEYFLTQFEILKSRDIAIKVIDQLNLRTHPEFDPGQQSSFLPKISLSALLSAGPTKEKSTELIEARKMTGVVNKFVARLKISPTRNTQLVKVKFESTSPRLAAEVVNTMAAVYINSHLEANLDAMRQAATKLGELKSKLDAAEQELQAYQDREGLIYASGAETPKEKQFKLRELEREAQTNRKLYDLFSTRTQEASESDSFQSAHARVVEKAQPPIGPIKPKKGLIIIIALIIGGMLGVVIAFLLDALDSTLKSPLDVRDHLRQPLLGILPILNEKDGDPRNVYKNRPQSLFSEAINTIRTGMVISGRDNPHKITVVTSSIAGEGTSTVSLNIAQSLSKMESVLLIDANMRRPTVATSFNLPQGTSGLSNLVAGTSSLECCIYKQDGFDIMPAGVIPSNPLELISSKVFKDLLLSLNQQYDRIIIDSAPVEAVSDSLILSTMADSIIYTIRANSTPLRAVASGIARFTHSNLPLTGIVLNRVDTDKLEKYGYDDDGYYGKVS
jgi:capsular exopolysaccharide synthesis family protein